MLHVNLDRSLADKQECPRSPCSRVPAQTRSYTSRSRGESVSTGSTHARVSIPMDGRCGSSPARATMYIVLSRCGADEQGDKKIGIPPIRTNQMQPPSIKRDLHKLLSGSMRPESRHLGPDRLELPATELGLHGLSQSRRILPNWTLRVTDRWSREQERARRQTSPRIPLRDRGVGRLNRTRLDGAAFLQQKPDGQRICVVIGK